MTYKGISIRLTLDHNKVGATSGRKPILVDTKHSSAPIRGDVDRESEILLME